jgi:hypothetical protein
MSKPVIRYRARLDATPAAELEVLAAVYSFLLQRNVNRKAAFGGGCADDKGGESDRKEVKATERR